MSKILEELDNDIKFFDSENQRIINRLENFKRFVSNIPQEVDSLSDEFRLKTGLRKEDYPFIFLCAGLQSMRQYFLTDFKTRLSDKDAAENIKGKTKESSARGQRKYYQSIPRIRLNPVPFDATWGSKELNAGISGNNHRFKCLGHDPILGYFFGTLNIMTGTITALEGISKTQNYKDFGIKNYFVKTDVLNYMKADKEILQFQDKLVEKAGPMSEIVDAVYQRIKNDPEEGIMALGIALRKEYLHLKSDKRSTQSLPIPAVSLISPDFAKGLSDIGIDFENLETIGKQAMCSYIINKIVHFLYYFIHESTGGYKDEHKVRLQSILNVGNAISTISNLAYCLVGSMFNESCFKKFDIGGTFITYRQLTNSADFINFMEREYINKVLTNKVEVL